MSIITTYTCFKCNYTSDDWNGGKCPICDRPWDAEQERVISDEDENE